MHKRTMVFILLISLLLTGCWDKLEIEERAHISALGIDKHDPSSEEENGPTQEQTNDYIMDKFAFTFVFPQTSLDEQENIVVKTVGESFFAVSRRLANRTNKEMFLGHLRTVILGVDVIKDEHLFREILDGIETNELISRRVILTVAEDKASDIIAVTPDMEPQVGQFIAELFRRRDRTPRTPAGSAGDILQDLHESGNTLIPKLTAGTSDIKAEGSAVIKNYKFEGWLGGIDTGHLMILKGEIPVVGGISVQYKGHSIPIDMRPEKPKVSLVEHEDNIKILIEVSAEADIKQTYFQSDEDLLKSETVEKIQKLVNIQIKENMEHAVNKIQKEFKTDVIGIDRYLRQRNYPLWKTIEDDWEEMFPDIEIEISVDVKIRRIGLVR